MTCNSDLLTYSCGAASESDKYGIPFSSRVDQTVWAGHHYGLLKRTIVCVYSTKLTENMQRDDMNFLRPLYCKYILREWNRKHPEKKLLSLKLFYMQKESLPDYKTTPVEKVLYCLCN